MNRFLIGETGEKAMTDKLTREDALALLQEKRRRTALKIQAREKRDSLEHPGL